VSPSHTVAPLLCCNGPATSVTSTLSLHDALPIYRNAASAGRFGALGQGLVHRRQRYAGLGGVRFEHACRAQGLVPIRGPTDRIQDRKSTRLNSSHVKISYAVFCLKKKISRHTIK